MINIPSAKDPDEVLDYTVDWSNRVTAPDTIMTSTWAFLTQAGLAKSSESKTDTSTTVWLTGGTSGETGVLLNTVVTTQGRTMEEVVTLSIVANEAPVPVPSGDYVMPTAQMLQAVYPAFASVPVSTIALYLAQAPVDETWLSGDYQTAIMAWAAHTMVGNGIGASEVASYAAAGVSRLKSGTLDVSFAAGSGGSTGYGSTSYGRLWLELLARNKGGPRIAVSPRGCGGWAATGIQNNGGLVPWVDY